MYCQPLSDCLDILVDRNVDIFIRYPISTGLDERRNDNVKEATTQPPLISHHSKPLTPSSQLSLTIPHSRYSTMHRVFQTQSSFQAEENCRMYIIRVMNVKLTRGTQYIGIMYCMSQKYLFEVEYDQFGINQIHYCSIQTATSIQKMYTNCRGDLLPTFLLLHTSVHP